MCEPIAVSLKGIFDVVEITLCTTGTVFSACSFKLNISEEISGLISLLKALCVLETLAFVLIALLLKLLTRKQYNNAILIYRNLFNVLFTPQS